MYHVIVNPVNEIRLVDAVLANGVAYLNIANIGLDACIVQNALTLKKAFKRYAYLAAVFKSIVNHKNVAMHIDADGETLTGEYTLAAICNGLYCYIF